MSGDTDEGRLPQNERKLIDRIAKAARGGEDQQILVINKGGESNGSFSKVRDALLPVAVAALVATVWNMSINMAEMRATLTSVVAELKEIKDDLKRVKP